ncbi:DUF6114 domain-containing protein [Virgibacillus sp. JSM 102003]|uniref:DUF6114 domain-containing protein n=1 Tax=Virgibacillus sp. JSM 102003 TaxID=1562108 RepID=UPI0035C0839A
MNRKEAKALKREEKLQGKHRKVANGGKFKKWRNKRPFWGASLILLAGLMILYIPLHLYAIAFIPGSFVFVGFLFGGLILIMGILDYIYPQFSTVFGVVTIFLSILSVMGALGGFVIGTVIGIIGGAMSIAWEKQEVTITEAVPNKEQLDQDDVTNEFMEEKEVKTVQA